MWSNYQDFNIDTGTQSISYGVPV